jgi:hypothetical protein
MGAHGSLFVFTQEVMASSGNGKTFRLKIGGTQVTTQGYTTSLQSCIPRLFRNKGVVNRNVSNASAGFATSGVAGPTHTQIDTSTDQTLLLTVQLANAADYAGFDGVMIQVNPAD